MSQPVTFHSQGARLRGSLWLPPGGPRPAVVVLGSWLTVKEQMPASYAPLLARAGFAALTFDFHGFGQSEGAPREVESGRSKAEDIRNALAFLAGHPEVDGKRLGAVCICASSAYIVSELVRPTHVKSVAMIAPWIHDAGIAAEIYGGEDAVKKRIVQAIAARESFARTGEIEYVPAVSSSDQSAAMYGPGDMFDYYLNPRRGAVPEWGGRFAVMAWKEWLELDPISLAPGVRVPVRIITSEKSATPAGARKFEAGLRGKHDSVWMEGTQFHFYDDPATVARATAHAVEHLEATL